MGRGVIGFKLAFDDELQEIGVYASVRLDSKEKAVKNIQLMRASTHKQDEGHALEDL